MKEYFSHDFNARNDTKLTKVFMKHGVLGIGIYWCIIEMLYEESGYLEISEYERIAFELRVNIETIKSIIEDFNLFENDSEKFWSNSAISRLKQRMEKSQKARESVMKRWDKYERNTNVKDTKNDSNTSKVKESKVKEINRSKFKNFDQVVSHFDSKFYQEKKWLETYDKLIRIDGFTEYEILNIVKEFRSDGNWWKDNGNFESLVKLRQKNKEDIKYIDLFKQKMPKHNESAQITFEDIN